MTTMPVPEDLLRRIRQGNRFLLTSHSNPDGDSVGSEVGLARVLRRLGKSAAIWNRDQTPTIYGEVPGVDRIHSGEVPPPGFPDSFDTFVLLECPSPDRTGLEDHLSGHDLINIDHHLGNQLYGVVNWIDTGAPAVGEMVYRLARILKIDLDPDTATALYLTLAADTGGFRFSNTTRSAFEAAATLVDEGASPEQVARWLYENRSPATLRLLGHMLQTLELHADGRIVTVFLTREMYEKAEATQSDAEGLIDYPRSIAGVEAVALLRQTDEEEYKVSLRSRGDLDVEKVARGHGGGGHHNAAGFVIQGESTTACEKVVAELLSALE